MRTTLYDALLESNLVFGKEWVAHRDTFFPSVAVLPAKVSKSQVHDALCWYLQNNPVFDHFELRESSVNTIFDLSYQNLFCRMVEHLPNDRNSFAIELCQMPGNSVIVGYFPINRLDGFTCFKFHLSLSKSLEQRKDCFAHLEAVSRFQLKTKYESPRFETPINSLPKVPEFYEIYRGSLDKKLIHDLALESANRSPRKRPLTFMALRNVLYQEQITFGNFLITPMVMHSPKMTAMDLKSSLDVEYDHMIEGLRPLHERDFSSYLADYTRPHLNNDIFVLNNYGRVVADYKILQYRWSLPVMFIDSFVGANLYLKIDQHYHYCCGFLKRS